MRLSFESEVMDLPRLPAITGFHSPLSSSSPSQPFSISYSNLYHTSYLLVQALYEEIEKDSPGCSFASYPLLIGVAIPSSSSLFALSCNALHESHKNLFDDRSEKRKPFTIVTLDTSDPVMRSANILQSLTKPESEMFDMTGIRLIVTSGDDSSKHWARVSAEWSKEFNFSSRLRVFDLEEWITASVRLSSDEKMQWVSTCCDFDDLELSESMDESDIVIDEAYEGFLSETFELPCDSISHISFTSGSSTGNPKGCVLSLRSLLSYCNSKNKLHNVNQSSVVLLVSAATFDPALSDIIATFLAKCTLVVAAKSDLQSRLSHLIHTFQVTHILGTPSWFSHTDLMLNKESYFENLSCLQVIALGGESIPLSVIEKWARMDPCEKRARLLSTYGVTEACVYQTVGEIFQTEYNRAAPSPSFVGNPLSGIKIHTSHEVITPQGISPASSVDLSREIEVSHGEVIIEGDQVDHISCYYSRQPQGLMDSPFQKEMKPDGTTRYFYKTGDYGIIHANSMNGLKEVFILGRLDSAVRMIKVNGIRIDPREIEYSILKEHSTRELANRLQNNKPSPTVLDCHVSCIQEGDRSSILAYCVLSKDALEEAFFSQKALDKGVLCTTSPLLTLLHMRCAKTLKHGVIPSAFIIVSKIPLTSSGKRNPKELPALSECGSMGDALYANNADALIEEYGASGGILAREIIRCLNMQPCQYSSLTTKASFATLGCDSLAVTRIVRALYAAHHGVSNSRNIGGSFGNIDENGPFAVSHAFQSRDLGEYVAWLDKHDLFKTEDDNSKKETLSNICAAVISPQKKHDKSEEVLYDALFEAIALNQTQIAIALLGLGIDPSLSSHGGRLSKISGRIAMREQFTSSPLHLACIKGNYELVKALVSLGHSCTSPDANGSFPIHLVCMTRSTSTAQENDEDGVSRSKCLQVLLSDGKAPITIKDGNKQTILHCASRIGNVALVKFVIHLWREAGEDGRIPLSNATNPAEIWNWRDRWGRTAVHWAVLNGHLHTLQLLLDAGCHPNPPRVKRLDRKSSAINETPVEICQRVYINATDDARKQNLGADIMKCLLVTAKNTF